MEERAEAARNGKREQHGCCDIVFWKVECVNQDMTILCVIILMHGILYAKRELGLVLEKHAPGMPEVSSCMGAEESGK